MDHPGAQPMMAPEGQWCFALTRRAHTISFHSDVFSTLTIAKGADRSYLVFNVHSMIYVYELHMNERDPYRRIDLKQPTTVGIQAPYITRLCVADGCTDEYDTLVALSTGEIKLISLQTQLAAPSFQSKPVSLKSFNADGAINSSKCVSVAWLPNSRGQSFIAAYADGAVYLYNQKSKAFDTLYSSNNPSASGGKNANNNSNGTAPTTDARATTASTGCVVLQRPSDTNSVAAIAISPDGQTLAVACKDGVLRVYDIRSTSLIGGFKSYYGGLLSVAWSPDARYIATGGEDDMVCLYGMSEHCVVYCCEGHNSWVSAVAFDPWMCQPTDLGGGGVQDANASSSSSYIYRIASVGQDCQVLLWDVYIGDESLQPLSPMSLANHRRTQSGRLVQSLPPSGLAANPAAHHKRPTNGFGSMSSSVGSSPKTGLLNGSVIASPLLRVDMNVQTPLVQQRVYTEPLCDVVFTEDGMLIACHDGSVQKWKRPVVVDSMES